jgi:hypothetical protein
MVRLKCSGVRFGSQLDEKHLFEWAAEISCFLRWEQDTLVVRSRNISREALYDLIALFWRYQIPMKQLAQFENQRNSNWFRNNGMYWHEKVFALDESLLNKE